MENDGFLMGASTANVNTIVCKDCLYRDHTVVMFAGKKRPVGITRDTCAVYTGEKGNFKPSAICFHNLPCEFYEKE